MDENRYRQYHLIRPCSTEPGTTHLIAWFVEDEIKEHARAGGWTIHREYKTILVKHRDGYLSEMQTA
jgi:hypothetical protein